MKLKQTASIASAVLSLLLHALLLAPMLWAGAAKKPDRTPDTLGATVRPGQSNDPEAMELILLPTQTAVDAPPLLTALTPDLSLRRLAPLDALPPPRTEDLVEASEDAEPASPAGEDEAGRAAMFGRYLGQITARIQRAWLRPRTLIGEGAFACQIRIRQDRIGNVQEVELGACNGDTRWQLSVVRAIQSASPLPAPPDPDVFTRVVTLQLTSQTFSPSQSEDGFEPDTAPAAQLLGR